MTEKTLIPLDYAIKYLLKDKSDYEIVEGFISAVLKDAGYSAVKINALLESNSNKGRELKKSVADVIVEFTELPVERIELLKEETVHE